MSSCVTKKDIFSASIVSNVLINADKATSDFIVEAVSKIDSLKETIKLVDKTTTAGKSEVRITEGQINDLEDQLYSFVLGIQTKDPLYLQQFINATKSAGLQKQSDLLDFITKTNFEDNDVTFNLIKNIDPGADITQVQKEINEIIQKKVIDDYVFTKKYGVNSYMSKYYDDVQLEEMEKLPFMQQIDQLEKDFNVELKGKTEEEILSTMKSKLGISDEYIEKMVEVNKEKALSNYIQTRYLLALPDLNFNALKNINTVGLSSGEEIKINAIVQIADRKRLQDYIAERVQSFSNKSNDEKVELLEAIRDQFIKIDNSNTSKEVIQLSQNIMQLGGTIDDFYDSTKRLYDFQPVEKFINKLSLDSGDELKEEIELLVKKNNKEGIDATVTEMQVKDILKTSLSNPVNNTNKGKILLNFTSQFNVPKEGKIRYVNTDVVDESDKLKQLASDAVYDANKIILGRDIVEGALDQKDLFQKFVDGELQGIVIENNTKQTRLQSTIDKINGYATSKGLAPLNIIYPQGGKVYGYKYKKGVLSVVAQSQADIKSLEKDINTIDQYASVENITPEQKQIIEKTTQDYLLERYRTQQSYVQKLYQKMGKPNIIEFDKRLNIYNDITENNYTKLIDFESQKEYAQNQIQFKDVSWWKDLVKDFGIAYNESEIVEDIGDIKEDLAKLYIDMTFSSSLLDNQNKKFAIINLLGGRTDKLTYGSDKANKLDLYAFAYDLFYTKGFTKSFDLGEGYKAMKIADDNNKMLKILDSDNAIAKAEFDKIDSETKKFLTNTWYKNRLSLPIENPRDDVEKAQKVLSQMRDSLSEAKAGNNNNYILGEVTAKAPTQELQPLYDEATKYNDKKIFIIDNMKDYTKNLLKNKEQIANKIDELGKEAGLPINTIEKLKSSLVGGPVDVLTNIKNKISRKIFAEVTGIKLPNTIKGTKEAIENYVKKGISDEVSRLGKIRENLYFGKENNKEIITDAKILDNAAPTQELQPLYDEARKYNDAEDFVDSQTIYRGQPEEFKELQKVDETNIYDNILTGKGIFTTKSKDVAGTYGKNILKFKIPQDKSKILDLNNITDEDIVRLGLLDFLEEGSYNNSFYKRYKEDMSKNIYKEAESFIGKYSKEEIESYIKSARKIRSLNEDRIIEAIGEEFSKGDSYQSIIGGYSSTQGKGVDVDEYRNKITNKIKSKGYDFIKHEGGSRTNLESHDVYIALKDGILNKQNEAQLRKIREEANKKIEINNKEIVSDSTILDNASYNKLLEDTTSNAIMNDLINLSDEFTKTKRISVKPNTKLIDNSLDQYLKEATELVNKGASLQETENLANKYKNIIIKYEQYLKKGYDKFFGNTLISQRGELFRVGSTDDLPALIDNVESIKQYYKSVSDKINSRIDVVKKMQLEASKSPEKYKEMMVKRNEELLKNGLYTVVENNKLVTVTLDDALAYEIKNLPAGSIQGFDHKAIDIRSLNFDQKKQVYYVTNLANSIIKNSSDILGTIEDNIAKMIPDLKNFFKQYREVTLTNPMKNIEIALPEKVTLKNSGADFGVDIKNDIDTKFNIYQSIKPGMDSDALIKLVMSKIFNLSDELKSQYAYNLFEDFAPYTLLPENIDNIKYSPSYFLPYNKVQGYEQLDKDLTINTDFGPVKASDYLFKENKPKELVFSYLPTKTSRKADIISKEVQAELQKRMETSIVDSNIGKNDYQESDYLMNDGTAGDEMKGNMYTNNIYNSYKLVESERASLDVALDTIANAKLADLPTETRKTIISDAISKTYTIDTSKVVKFTDQPIGSQAYIDNITDVIAMYFAKLKKNINANMMPSKDQSFNTAIDSLETVLNKFDFSTPRGVEDLQRMINNGNIFEMTIRIDKSLKKMNDYNTAIQMFMVEKKLPNGVFARDERTFGIGEKGWKLIMNTYAQPTITSSLKKIASLGPLAQTVRTVTGRSANGAYTLLISLPSYENLISNSQKRFPGDMRTAEKVALKIDFLQGVGGEVIRVDQSFLENVQRLTKDKNFKKEALDGLPNVADAIYRPKMKAISILEAIKTNEVQTFETIEDFDNFVTNYPNTDYKQQVIDAIKLRATDRYETLTGFKLGGGSNRDRGGNFTAVVGDFNNYKGSWGLNQQAYLGKSLLNGVVTFVSDIYNGLPPTEAMKKLGTYYAENDEFTTVFANIMRSGYYGQKINRTIADNNEEDQSGLGGFARDVSDILSTLSYFNSSFQGIGANFWGRQFLTYLNGLSYYDGDVVKPLYNMTEQLSRDFRRQTNAFSIAPAAAQAVLKGDISILLDGWANTTNGTLRFLSNEIETPLGMNYMPKSINADLGFLLGSNINRFKELNFLSVTDANRIQFVNAILGSGTDSLGQPLDKASQLYNAVYYGFFKNIGIVKAINKFYTTQEKATLQDIQEKMNGDPFLKSSVRSNVIDMSTISDPTVKFDTIKDAFKLIDNASFIGDGTLLKKLEDLRETGLGNVFTTSFIEELGEGKVGALKEKLLNTRGTDKSKLVEIFQLIDTDGVGKSAQLLYYIMQSDYDAKVEQRKKYNKAVGSSSKGNTSLTPQEDSDIKESIFKEYGGLIPLVDKNLQGRINGAYILNNYKDTVEQYIDKKTGVDRRGQAYDKSELKESFYKVLFMSMMTEQAVAKGDVFGARMMNAYQNAGRGLPANVRAEFLGNIAEKLTRAGLPEEEKAYLMTSVIVGNQDLFNDMEALKQNFPEEAAKAIQVIYGTNDALNKFAESKAYQDSYALNNNGKSGLATIKPIPTEFNDLRKLLKDKVSSRAETFNGLTKINAGSNIQDFDNLFFGKGTSEYLKGIIARGNSNLGAAKSEGIELTRPKDINRRLTVAKVTRPKQPKGGNKKVSGRRGNSKKSRGLT